MVAGALLLFASIALLGYLGTVLAFAPPLIVLERLGVVAAIGRSFALVRGDFWRVLGIWLLSTLVANMIAGAVSVPFAVGGQFMLLSGQSRSGTLVALVLISIGGAIGQIITAPFGAGVIALLYTDRRIRAEAFDLVLQTGAAGPADPNGSTDQLWLTARP